MGKSPREILSEEYCKMVDSIALRPLKIAGYLRFETKEGRFIEKLSSTIIRSLFMLLLGFFLAAYILYEYRGQYFLSITEQMTVAYIAIIQNSILINITFPNRNSGLVTINTCIEIDVILGTQETKFMRTVTVANFVVLSFFIALFQIAVSVVLYKAHHVSASIHFVGTLYFFIVFLIFFDACFLVGFYTFLSLRVHYLNVALIKLAKINSDYFANQLFFNGIFWRKSLDNFVTFHERAEPSRYMKVFNLIFKQLQQLEDCFRFTIFVAMTSLIIGTFLGVQTVILHKELPDINVLRTGAVIGWLMLGWMYLLMLSQHIDIFYRQLEKTGLICNFIQLKPIMSAQVLDLTKDVLRLLGEQDSRVCVYNMFFFNTNLVLQMAASIFVYITVQLQLSAPASRVSSEGLANVTDDIISPQSFIFLR